MHWRLIDTGPLTGPDNMAVDEALLQHFDPQGSVPIFRLYRWQPAALSIGRFQKAADELDLDRISADRLPLVRRITGGGAIYHTGELTYSVVCAPHHIPPAASIKDSFRVLTAFLLAFYRSLDLDACYAAEAACPRMQLGLRTPFCFAGQESYDILVNGRKIGGNAQRRLRRAIFQHGSIPVENHLEHGLAYLRARPPGVQAVATCLSKLGVTEPPEVLKQRLAESFGAEIGGELVADRLSPAESATASRLALEKYSSPCWNLGGRSA